MTIYVISLSITLQSFVIVSQSSLGSSNTVFIIDVCKRLISEFNMVSMVTIYRVRRQSDFFLTALYMFWKCFKSSLTILTFFLNSMNMFQQWWCQKYNKTNFLHNNNNNNNNNKYNNGNTNNEAPRDANVEMVEEVKHPMAIKYLRRQREKPNLCQSKERR